jgi:hypothetical protein
MTTVVSCLQPERRRLLDDLDALSQSMLEGAQAGEWDAVIAAQSEFECVLRRLCVPAPKPAEVTPLTLGLLRLQERIEELEVLTRSRQAELSSYLQRAQRQQDCARLYGAVGGPIGAGERG